MTTRDAIELAKAVVEHESEEAPILHLARALLVEHEQNAALGKRVAELEEGLKEACDLAGGTWTRPPSYSPFDGAETRLAELRSLLAKERGE